MSVNKQQAIPSKNLLVLLAGRITAYYLILAAVVFALSMTFPSLVAMAPIGGVGDLSGNVDVATLELEEALLGDYLEEYTDSEQARATQQSTFMFADARALFLAMLGTVLLMLPVSWVLKGIHQDGVHDQSLDETTLVLPAVVAGIVLIVQHSLALAFSLAGIVAGVQFRRSLSDTFDTLFIFVAIAVGIAAGIKALDIAVVLTVFFNYTTLLICIYGDGLESHHQAIKKRDKDARKKAEAGAQSEVKSE